MWLSAQEKLILGGLVLPALPRCGKFESSVTSTMHGYMLMEVRLSFLPLVGLVHCAGTYVPYRAYPDCIYDNAYKRLQHLGCLPAACHRPLSSPTLPIASQVSSLQILLLATDIKCSTWCESLIPASRRHPTNICLALRLWLFPDPLKLTTILCVPKSECGIPLLRSLHHSVATEHWPRELSKI